jgi:transcriptional regulator with XRE-family HTH domain
MNRGAAHVRAEIKARGLAQNEAARLVEYDSGNFSKLLKGEKGPGLKLALQCHSKFGTDPAWWDEEISEEEAAAMLAAVEPPPATPSASSESGEHPAVIEPTEGVG